MNSWVERLKRQGPDQANAILELGKILKVRISRAFRGNPRVDAALVDDAVQDSLTTILQSLDQFEGKSHFLTWATTLAVRTAIRETRRLRWKDTSLDQMMADQPAAVERSNTKDNPAAKAVSAQLVETMYQIIENDLTEKQRHVLLAHLRGMPQAEIARRIGSNRNSIYKLGFDARKKLKAGLIAAGYSAADLDILEGAR